MLEITQVRKTFAGAPVLRDVSLSIGDGEFFSLLGASGCGKTTLLRCVAGFETPDAGDLKLDGQSVVGLPPHKRPVNMVFQRYALFPHLDVYKNVAFPLEVRKTPVLETRKRVEEALALVALSGFEHRRALTLSGGEQQRVALARALVGRPKLLLLDEPLSALDLKLRQKMQTELRALQRRLGMTFVFVTHAQDEALSLSDRIAVMHQGRVEQVGTPAALYERPASRYVATFVGTVNRLSREGGEIFVRPEKVTLRAAASGISGAGASVGSSGAPAGAENRDELRFAASVRQVFYRGATVDVEVALDGGDAPWTASLPSGAPAPHIGARVDLAFSKRDILPVGPS